MRYHDRLEPNEKKEIKKYLSYKQKKRESELESSSKSQYKKFNDPIDNLKMVGSYFLKGVTLTYLILSLSSTTEPLSSVSDFASKEAILPKKLRLETTVIEEENKNKYPKDDLLNLVDDYSKKYFINYKNCD